MMGEFFAKKEKFPNPIKPSTTDLVFICEPHQTSSRSWWTFSRLLVWNHCPNRILYFLIENSIFWHFCHPANHFFLLFPSPICRSLFSTNFHQNSFDVSTNFFCFVLFPPTQKNSFVTVFLERIQHNTENFVFWVFTPNFPRWKRFILSPISDRWSVLVDFFWLPPCFHQRNPKNSFPSFLLKDQILICFWHAINFLKKNIK